MIKNLVDMAGSQVAQLFGGYVPSMLGAVAILIGGWLVARLVAWVVTNALGKTTIDNRLAAWISGPGQRDLAVERWVGQAVFYLIMLFVLMAFFQALRLTVVTEPLTALLDSALGFVPRVVGAGVLLLIAWILATGFRLLVQRGLTAAGLDRRLGAQTEDGKAVPVSKSIGEAVYWLVFLLFLPAVLGALALEGLLRPVQLMLDKILGFLPQLVAAGFILLVGWFVARIVSRIVANLLAAAGLDRLGERVGLEHGLGGKRPSTLVGLLVYVLILLPVITAALEALALEAVTRPVSGVLEQILGAVPALFTAVLLLGLAYVVGRVLASLVSGVLAGAGFNSLPERLGLGRMAASGPGAPASVAGTLVLVAVMLLAATEAGEVLGFTAIAGLVSELVQLGGRVVLGLIIFGVGLYLGRLAGGVVRSSRTATSAILAMATQASIVVLAGAIALRHMGLANEIVNLAFGLLLGAIAVAVGLAFGLGGRETAAQLLGRWSRHVEGGATRE